MSIEQVHGHDNFANCQLNCILQKNYTGESALMVTRSLDDAVLLLEAGADATAATCAGKTFLHHCVIRKWTRKMAEVRPDLLQGTDMLEARWENLTPLELGESACTTQIMNYVELKLRSCSFGQLFVWVSTPP